MFSFFQSLLGLDEITCSDVDHLTSLINLRHLELGDCNLAPPSLLQSLSGLKLLTKLRIERIHLGINLSELRWLHSLHSLELIDVQLKEGFGDGLVKMLSLNKLLIIPVYKDEVNIINSIAEAGTILFTSLFFRWQP
jgi:hypothetical protein